MIQLKIFIKFIAYIITGHFIRANKEIKSKTLLLIRLDAIGDYVLFRNFIEEIKRSGPYKEYQITLLGNSTWKDLSEELDNTYVDKFIWVDRNRFNKDFKYRYTKLKEVVSKGYEVVLSPVYSREYFYADIIVKLVNAKKKIGSDGDLSTIKKWQKKISDTYYSELIPAKDELLFEFNRNREFFENLLERDIDISKPTIKLKTKVVNYDLSKKYAVLFIGASARSKKWSIENFADIARHLKIKHGEQIVLCGGPTDRKDANEFSKCFDDNYIDLVGKTSLLDLLYIISNANMMISNDTAAPHLAIALERTNIFVIYNGNHYGRFIPYPKETTTNYHVVYHPQIDKDFNNDKKLCNIYKFGSSLDINDISLEQVIGKIDKVLNSGIKND